MFSTSDVSSEICNGSHFSIVEKISSPPSLVLDEDALEDVYIEHSEGDSDADFILLGKPAPAARSSPRVINHSEVEQLSSAFGELSMDSCSAAGYGLNVTAEDGVKKFKRALKRKRQNAARKGRRRAQREQTISTSHTETTSVSSYEEASALISRYITHPQAEGNDELLLLQALMVELGIRSPGDLPSTLTSARKVFKSEVHINIRDYVDTRHKGQKALRQIMHPSKNSLRREIQKTGKRASLKWVKQRGLRALLVKAFE
ncbi:hypothetical protein EDD17DRAFT_1103051 [Pisolithus thermaeus]|nr:hypothetical protein EDD17DRAFT_1103051 [Pisolithus thermaeus]